MLRFRVTASFPDRFVLLRVLKDMFRRRSRSDAAQAELENERRKRTMRAHAAAPIERHLEIALGGICVGEHDLRELTNRCLADADMKVSPLKALHRPLASYFLARYFIHAMELGGDFAECGVYTGISALFVCRAARTRSPAYAGEGLHLVDSFAGLSEPREEDFYETRAEDGSVVPASIPRGSFAAGSEVVRNTMREFPATSIHQGWIPDVFRGLPETRWAYVHVDVDHYQPTADCLEYFYPRLRAGGVIICDDYGAPLFPGARRAWDRYCERHGVPFVVLDTGQSVILKTGDEEASAR
jgi:hypothetical protein